MHAKAQALGPLGHAFKGELKRGAAWPHEGPAVELVAGAYLSPDTRRPQQMHCPLLARLAHVTKASHPNRHTGVLRSF